MNIMPVSSAFKLLNLIVIILHILKYISLIYLRISIFFIWEKILLLHVSEIWMKMTSCRSGLTVWEYSLKRKVHTYVSFPHMAKDNPLDIFLWDGKQIKSSNVNNKILTVYISILPRRHIMPAGVCGTASQSVSGI